MEALPAWLVGTLVVLLFTSFVKIATALSILRYGIGLEGAGFGAAVLAAALALSFLIMSPQIEKAGGLGALFGGPGKAPPQSVEAQFRPFLEKHTPTEMVTRFRETAAKLAATGETAPPAVTPFPVLASAFLVSELKEAFLLGLVILIPFVVLDLLTANVLMSLGVTQLPYQSVSLPLKLALFFAVDGWTLVSEKLIGTYLS